MKTKTDGSDSEGGVILNPPVKEKSQRKKWIFTWNNYKQNHVAFLLTELDKVCEKYVFQEEIGSEGTEHLQGYIHLHKACRLKWLKDNISDKAHFEHAKGTEKQNILYCSKNDTHKKNTKPYIKGLKIPKPLELITELYPWQKELVQIISTSPDSRAIYWIYDDIGNSGKSALCKYLVHKHQALYIDEGDKKDLTNLVYNMDMDQCELIVIDIPRANGNKCSYKCLESFKNGMICNTKYETGMKLFNPPHIVVFSNSLPDIYKLSLDRWHIYSINDKKEFYAMTVGQVKFIIDD